MQPGYSSTYAPRAISTPDDARAWEPPSGPWVLIISYAWFGQGHVSRCLKLANAFRTRTSLEPVVVSGSPEFFRSLPGLAFRTVTLPPFIPSDPNDPGWNTAQPSFMSSLPNVPAGELGRYRGHLLASLARSGPSAVLIDHFPFSGAKSEEACGELVRRLAESDPPVPVFAGFRGLVSERSLLDERTPAVVSDLLPYLERIFVFLDDEDPNRLLDLYPFLRPFRSRLELVGHVGPGTVALDPPEPGLVLATFGSGIDAYHRLDVTCEAFELAREHRGDLRLELVTGRRLSRPLYERLVASYASESVEIIRHVDLLPRRFSAAELLVCGAGNNTLIEASTLASGRILAIPHSWSPTSEQLQTAARFEATGGIDLLLARDDLEPRRLADRMLTVLDGPARPRPTLDLHGAERTVRRIERILTHGLG